MATEKQVEANRLNALKSTGPKTPEGKSASRRNALKHGMAAVLLLPEQDEAAAAGRAEAWARDLNACTPFQLFLVAKMAADSIRVERCSRRYNELKTNEGTRAEESWDEDRSAAADKLGRRIHRDPSRILYELRTTLQGCRWLVSRWNEWIADVTARGLDAGLTNRALDLMGKPVDRREGVEVEIEEGFDARIELETRMAGAIGRLDDAERDMAEAGIGPDDVEARRVQRYESGCMRRLQWAHAQIQRSKQGKAPSKRPKAWADMDYPGTPVEPMGTKPIPKTAPLKTNPISASPSRVEAPLPRPSGVVPVVEVPKFGSKKYPPGDAPGRGASLTGSIWVAG